MSWSSRGRPPGPVLALFVAFALSACVPPPGPPEPCGRYVHVVLVWLKEPGNSAQIDSLIEATRGFRSIPGVREVRVGRAVPSERPVVDDSFDVGLYLVFDSRADLQAYQQHPLHRTAARETLAPLAGRLVVYDFVDACAAGGGAPLSPG